MGISAIHLRDAGIPLDHRQVCVSQQGLKCEKVAIVTQVIDGECMTEPMGIGVSDTGPLTDAAYQLGERSASNGLRAVFRVIRKQGIINPNSVQAR